MKKLLVFLLIFPLVTFSQVSSWRSNSPSKVPSGPTIQGQRSDISMWRTNPPREDYRSRPTKPGSNIIVNNNSWGWNDWGWNRWNMWGAPIYGFNYYNPYWYWNDWGYRQPGRIYIYENGKRDTIKGKKPIINFVLHKTTNQQIGASFTIGNKNYFIMDFVSTYEPDRSTYFPYGNITQVDFPLINDLIKERTLYIGGGTRFKRVGFHAMVGFGRENIFWRGRDNLGEITFPKSSSNFTTFKVGLLKDIKNFTLKVDTDPIRNYSQFGVGINF